MANNKRNNQLTEIVQAIKDMVIALLINQILEGTIGSQCLDEFKRNKPAQLSGGYNPKTS